MLSKAIRPSWGRGGMDVNVYTLQRTKHVTPTRRASAISNCPYSTAIRKARLISIFSYQQ